MGACFFKTKKEKLTEVPPSIYDLSAEDIDGKTVSISDFQDKKVLVFVNVASSCGLTTKQYRGLNKIYDKFSSQGLEILAFPCNQFMGQESKCGTDIKEFVTQHMKVKFPLFAKIEVNGPNTHPIYRFLRANSRLYDAQTGTLQEIPWNFAKFVVDRNGKVVELLGPDVAAEDLEKIVVPLLA